MSEAKFTPGPWLRIDTEDYAEIHAQFRPSSQAVALVGKADDANLIAASPDLYDALREAKGLADMAVMSDDGDGTPSDDQSSLEQLRAKIDAALAKAEGRSL